MKLYCMHFNFCRGHGGLRYKDERGIECKNTPAREAGIVDSIWTLKELLTGVLKHQSNKGEPSTASSANLFKISLWTV